MVGRSRWVRTASTGSAAVMKARMRMSAALTLAVAAAGRRTGLLPVSPGATAMSRSRLVTRSRSLASGARTPRLLRAVRARARAARSARDGRARARGEAGAGRLPPRADGWRRPRRADTPLRQDDEWEYAFVRAGGKLTAGVDPWGNGSLPGYGDQRNYELLVEAGFSRERSGSGRPARLVLPAHTERRCRRVGQAAGLPTDGPKPRELSAQHDDELRGKSSRAREGLCLGLYDS
jgi:hypothetical protein